MIGYVKRKTDVAHRLQECDLEFEKLCMDVINHCTLPLMKLCDMFVKYQKFSYGVQADMDNCPTRQQPNGL